MYEVEESPTGRFFVSLMGWGRPFSTLEAAEKYADFMNSTLLLG